MTFILCLKISLNSCQFPTMGFVVERFKQIQSFCPEPFWKIKVSYLWYGLAEVHVNGCRWHMRRGVAGLIFNGREFGSLMRSLSRFWLKSVRLYNKRPSPQKCLQVLMPAGLTYSLRTWVQKQTQEQVEASAPWYSGAREAGWLIVFYDITKHHADVRHF